MFLFIGSNYLTTNVNYVLKNLASFLMFKASHGPFLVLFESPDNFDNSDRLWSQLIWIIDALL